MVYTKNKAQSQSYAKWFCIFKTLSLKKLLRSLSEVQPQLMELEEFWDSWMC